MTIDQTQQAYVARLENMNDDELFQETENKIWLSAYANNNPRSAYHWQCDATYNECLRRGSIDIYTKAYDKCVKENGR